jgi:protein phosphatase PTC7
MFPIVAQAIASPAVGATTACVCVVDAHRRELSASNVGDSGFVVLRRVDGDTSKASSAHPAANGGTTAAIDASDSYKGWRTVFTSPQQLVYFNCPYQLGRAPSAAVPGTAGAAASSSTSESAADAIKFHTPADAVNLRVPLVAGDIVVLATDGLFDNCEAGEVLRTAVDAVEHDDRAASSASTSSSSAGVSTSFVGHTHANGAGTVAHKLLALAHAHSLNRDRDSPFAQLAKENMILWRYGGRPDDITVLVCRILGDGDGDTGGGAVPLSVAFPAPARPVIL